MYFASDSFQGVCRADRGSSRPPLVKPSIDLLSSVGKRFATAEALTFAAILTLCGVCHSTNNRS